MPDRPTRKRLNRAEQRAETRRRLLDSAAKVFNRRGLADASIEEICEEAGFSRGAFYSNFESKEQLFTELLHERVYAGYRELVARVPQDASPLEQLRWMADDLKERYGREEDDWLFTLWLELLAHAARNPEFRALPATFWKDTRTLGAMQIQRAFETAGKTAPTEPRELAIAMTALDIGLAVQNLVDPDEVPLDLYPRLFEILFGRVIDSSEP